MVERRILLPSGGVSLWSLLFVIILIVMKVCPTFSPVDLYPAPGPPEPVWWGGEGHDRTQGLGLLHVGWMGRSSQLS